MHVCIGRTLHLRCQYALHGILRNDRRVAKTMAVGHSSIVILQHRYFLVFIMQMR